MKDGENKSTVFYVVPEAPDSNSMEYCFYKTQKKVSKIYNVRKYFPNIVWNVGYLHPGKLARANKK